MTPSLSHPVVNTKFYEVAVDFNSGILGVGLRVGPPTFLIFSGILGGERTERQQEL